MEQKFVLFAVFEAGSSVDVLFLRLHEKGINGTYLPGASINTLVSNWSESEPAVISLKKALGGSKNDNPTFFVILKEAEFPLVKQEIEDYTDHFKKIRGGIFMWPLSFFEGSF
jgi:hypothetical protein